MDKICKNCKNWNLCIETVGYLPEDKSGTCHQIRDKIDVNVNYGWEGGYVASIETNAMFGCVLFEECE